MTRIIACFGIFTADKIYIVVLWGMTGCMLLGDYWCFGRTYCLLQGSRLRRLFSLSLRYDQTALCQNQEDQNIQQFHYFLYTSFPLGLYQSVRPNSHPQNLPGAYKLSEDFAKPYFHKYVTEIHDVTTILKRNVCSFVVTLILIVLKWRIG